MREKTLSHDEAVSCEEELRGCHAQPCLPRHLNELSRREFLRHGVALSAYLSMGSLLLPKERRALAAQSFPLQRKLVWINMSGGWDILEVLDPKPASSSGLDMIYDYGLSHTLAGNDSARLGRWMGRTAGLGDDVLIVKGLTMGTTSHQAGPIYMDTGILSNAGRVNSASIPAIVASESAATIPILQLAGGMNPQSDRGLLKPVSVVRAENLDLYRSLYPAAGSATEIHTAIIDAMQESLTRLRSEVSPDSTINDRLKTLESAGSRVREQFSGNIASQLQVTAAELASFADGAPRGANQGTISTFALAEKLLINDISDVINIGIGGFDTHSGQSSRLEPILGLVDFTLERFVSRLKTAGVLDKTLIVLYSDFGRTPKMNASNGRDHWPVGGALMIGGGIAGARSVGASDENLRALNINLSTGLADASGSPLSPIHLAGSVLELTLGADYLPYRNYLTAIGALTKLKG